MDCVIDDTRPPSRKWMTTCTGEMSQAHGRGPDHIVGRRGSARTSFEPRRDQLVKCVCPVCVRDHGDLGWTVTQRTSRRHWAEVTKQIDAACGDEQPDLVSDIEEQGDASDSGDDGGPASDCVSVISEGEPPEAARSRLVMGNPQLELMLTCRIMPASSPHPHSGPDSPPVCTLSETTRTHTRTQVPVCRRKVFDDLIADPMEPVSAGGVCISRLHCCMLLNSLVAAFPSAGKVWPVVNTSASHATCVGTQGAAGRAHRSCTPSAQQGSHHARG